MARQSPMVKTPRQSPSAKKCEISPIFKVPRGPAPGTLIRRNVEDLEEAIRQLLMVKSKYSVFKKYETEKHLMESCGKMEELEEMFEMLMEKLEGLRKASEEEKDGRGC